MRRNARGTAAQSTVELALVSPIVLMLMLWIAQFGLLFAQKITLVHVGRETARAVALYNSAEVARQAATNSSSLAEDRLQVEITGDTSPGAIFAVKVTYLAATDVPLVGQLLGDITLTSQTHMRSEG